MTDQPIPAEILHWAAGFYDEHLCTEEVTMVALAFMAGQASAQPTGAGLTPRQRNAFSFVKSYINDKDGLSPTVREVADHQQLTLSRAHAVLKQLEHRGFISMVPRCARSITITARA